VQRNASKSRDRGRANSLFCISTGFIEKQAEDPLPLGGGMNAVPTAFETEAKSISS